MYRYLAQGGPGTDKCSTKRKKLGKSTDRKARGKAKKAKMLEKKKVASALRTYRKACPLGELIDGVSG